MTVTAMLLLPLLAAALCALPPIRRLAPVLTVALSVAVLVLAAQVAWQASNGVKPEVWTQWMSVDALSALMLLLIALVGTTAAVFSTGYIGRSVEPRRAGLYYANYNLFVFSMLAIPVLSEPTSTWIVVELTTVCSAMLVCFEGTREAFEAAWKYVVLSLMGAAVALLGFLLLFAAQQASGTGSYTWGGLLDAAPHMPPVLLYTSFVLVLIGLGTKVGLVPMHTWLPDAHSQAPSPVCALLSGVETTAVLYVILRLVPLVGGTGLRTWALAFGLLSVGTAAFLLLQVHDYKRMFAFSTVEHMGIILVAAGLGSTAALYGALFQALSHTLTKSFCFFAAGSAALVTGQRDIASVRGLIRTAPMVGACLLLGGLAIAGAPPFVVFLSEFSIFRAGLQTGHFLAVGLLVCFIAIGFLGILSHLNRMVFGPSAAPAGPRRLVPLPCLATLCVAGFLVVALGWYVPAPLHDLLRLGVSTLER